jgi:hypothetical protein
MYNGFEKRGIETKRVQNVAAAVRSPKQSPAPKRRVEKKLKKNTKER